MHRIDFVWGGLFVIAITTDDFYDVVFARGFTKNQASKRLFKKMSHQVG